MDEHHENCLSPPSGPTMAHIFMHPYHRQALASASLASQNKYPSTSRPRCASLGEHSSPFVRKMTLALLEFHWLPNHPLKQLLLCSFPHVKMIGTVWGPKHAASYLVICLYIVLGSGCDQWWSLSHLDRIQVLGGVHLQQPSTQENLHCFLIVDRINKKCSPLRSRKCMTFQAMPDRCKTKQPEGSRPMLPCQRPTSSSPGDMGPEFSPQVHVFSETNSGMKLI